MRLWVRQLTGVRPSPAHREGPGRGLRYCCPGQAAQLTNSPLGSNIFRPGANIARSARRPLSLPPKLLAICEKLHNLGIYSYALGEWIGKPGSNTLSITRVGHPTLASPHVACRSTTVPRLDRGMAAISPGPLARPDSSCHGGFLLWSTLLAISAVCKKFDWRRYRCS
jgi:hypothetical protein